MAGSRAPGRRGYGLWVLAALPVTERDVRRFILLRGLVLGAPCLPVAAFAGCGGSNPSDPGPETTLTLSIVSGDGQVGAIGVAVGILG